MSQAEMNARIRAIKESANVAYDRWVASVRVGYVASAFQAVASQMIADQVLASRKEAYDAHERALAAHADTERTAQYRVARAA